jgi:hypothetical protein
MSMMCVVLRDSEHLDIGHRCAWCGAHILTGTFALNIVPVSPAGSLDELEGEVEEEDDATDNS